MRIFVGASEHFYSILQKGGLNTFPALYQVEFGICAQNFTDRRSVSWNG